DGSSFFLNRITAPGRLIARKIPRNHRFTRVSFVTPDCFIGAVHPCRRADPLRLAAPFRQPRVFRRKTPVRHPLGTLVALLPHSETTAELSAETDNFKTRRHYA